MKNLHTRLFVLILILLAGALYAVVKLPLRKGLDIQGGMRVVLKADKTKAPPGTWNADKLEVIRGIMENRVNGLGVAEPVIYTKPDQDQIVVELPGVKNKADALAAIQTTARLEFRYVPMLDSREWTDEPERINGKETGFYKILNQNGTEVSPEELQARVFSQPPVLTGADLEPNSTVELGPRGVVIHFEFRGQAKKVFEDFTRANINKRLAIFLDNRLISAPTINDVIPGAGIIEGRFTIDQAKTLSNQLNAGALPVPLILEQQQNIEATLGDEAVHKTVIAGIIGLVLVLVFMIYMYKVPGVLADLALILYTIFSLALFKLIPVTLTLPGIAGFILSIGMAVDANILIFERMKEERHAGKSLRASIEAGFKRAFTAILDSNVCTLITCSVLYTFGTGSVKGFALTLAIGVLVSMFTAITCSRTFLVMLTSTPAGQNDKLYPLGKGFHPKLNVVKNMYRWYTVSALVIVPGLIFWLGLHGTKYSIEFEPGTEIGVRFTKALPASDIRSIVAQAGYRDSRVLLAQDNMAYINTKLLNQTQLAELTARLKSAGGIIESTSTASPAISKELTANAIKAVFFASLLIVLYLAVRFAIGGFMEGLRFGVCAVIAMLHDVAVLWGIFAIFGFFLNWQVDSLFVTAMLTVIGFSVHDTIVIFDRMRENLRHRARGETFGDVTDRSIEQTFSRSIATSFTVVLTLTALLVFGGSTIRVFVTALLLGVISGTYSSIFNASPLVVLWKRLSGDTTMPTPATAPAGAPRVAPRPNVEAPARPRPPRPTAPKPAAESAAETEAAPSTRSKKRKRRM